MSLEELGSIVERSITSRENQPRPFWEMPAEQEVVDYLIAAINLWGEEVEIQRKRGESKAAGSVRITMDIHGDQRKVTAQYIRHKGTTIEAALPEISLLNDIYAMALQLQHEKHEKYTTRMQAGNISDFQEALRMRYRQSQQKESVAVGVRRSAEEANS